jgi:hypothetical protein
MLLANDSQQPGIAIQAKAVGSVLSLTNRDGASSHDPAVALRRG